MFSLAYSYKDKLDIIFILMDLTDEFNGWLFDFFTVFAFVDIIFILITLVPKLLNIMLPLNESRSISIMLITLWKILQRKILFLHYVYCVRAEIVLIAVLAHDCMFLVYSEHLQSPCFGWVRKTSIFFAMFQHDWLGERSCRLNTCRFHLEMVSCNSRNDVENNRPNDRKIYDRKISVMHTDELYGEQYYIS